MTTKTIISNGISGIIGFVTGYIIGDAVGAPYTGGTILGIEAIVSKSLRSYATDFSKENDWKFSVKEAAKSGVSLASKTVGRILMIGLHILYPGNTGGASLWAGISLITGIARIAFTYAMHEVATQCEWNHSTVLIAESLLSVLGDGISTITLVAIGILSSSGVVIALSITLALFSASLCNALLVKYNGTDKSFNKINYDVIPNFI